MTSSMIPEAVASLQTLVTDAKSTLTVVGGSPVDGNKPALSTSKQLIPKNLDAEVTKSLKWHLNERKGLKHFYPTLEPTPEHVTAAVSMVRKLVDRGVKVEKAIALTWLALYDMAMLLDDSISMGFEENAKNVEVLKNTVRTVAGIFELSRSNPDEGISNVRFLNSGKFATNLKPKRVNGLFKDLSFHGETRIGSALSAKILKKYDFTTAKKPLIVIVVTDGEIEGESPDFLKKVIINRAAELRKLTNDTEFGAHAISYQFAALGEDEGAETLITKLDDDEKLGDFIDCMEKKSLENLASKENSENKWNAATKLLLGSISKYYDELSLFTEESIEASDSSDFRAAEHSGEAENEYKQEDEEEDEEDWF